MGSLNSAGRWVPAPGDTLQSAFELVGDHAGGFVTVNSLSAARSVAAQIRQRRQITPQMPVFFDIGGVAYRHDGTQLKPLNEPESGIVRYSAANRVYTVSAGQFSGMFRATLPVAPYPRTVKVDVQAYAGNVTGTAFLSGQVQGLTLRSAWAKGTSSTANLALMGVVPAGSAPVIEAGIFGGESGCTVNLSGSESLNVMMWMAHPKATEG